MLGHEVLEVLLGILATRVLVEQIVEVVEHLVDRLPIFVTGVLQCLLHPGETLVEHLAAEQVFDLVVLLLGFTAAPLILREFLNGFGR